MNASTLTRSREIALAYSPYSSSIEAIMRLTRQNASLGKEPLLRQLHVAVVERAVCHIVVNML